MRPDPYKFPYRKQNLPQMCLPTFLQVLEWSRLVNHRRLDCRGSFQNRACLRAGLAKIRELEGKGKRGRAFGALGTLWAASKLAILSWCCAKINVAKPGLWSFWLHTKICILERIRPTMSVLLATNAPFSTLCPSRPSSKNTINML